jgi:small GTP-binding protein
MLGAFSVGKTSLVSRFVFSLFSEKYMTTVGVKIDKKVVTANGEEISLLIWDIYGEDAIQQIRSSYVRGAAGYLLVADGTRPETIEIARRIRSRMESELGPVPFVLMVNKADLREEWKLGDGELEDLRNEGWPVLRCSARTGEGVEEGFLRLATDMQEPPS